MILEDGRLYTPEEVCEAGWLGSDTTPEALRKGTRRTPDPLPCTKFPPNGKRPRIYFTRANILAIQEKGLREGRQDASARTTSRRGRRTSPDLSLLPGGEPFQADPSRRRRSRKKSA